MELISNLEHKDCFSLNSPFGYLIDKKAKKIAEETFPPGHPLLENIQQSYKHRYTLLKRK